MAKKEKKKKKKTPLEDRGEHAKTHRVTRTGTLGLFQALKILGYRPFHISELLPYGVPQMKALEEAMVASSDAPFTRAEFDKLFGGYDVGLSCVPVCHP